MNPPTTIPAPTRATTKVVTEEVLESDALDTIQLSDVYAPAALQGPRTSAPTASVPSLRGTAAARWQDALYEEYETEDRGVAFGLARWFARHQQRFVGMADLSHHLIQASRLPPEAEIRQTNADDGLDYYEGRLAQWVYRDDLGRRLHLCRHQKTLLFENSDCNSSPWLLGDGVAMIGVERLENWDIGFDAEGTPALRNPAGEIFRAILEPTNFEEVAWSSPSGELRFNGARIAGWVLAQGQMHPVTGSLEGERGVVRCGSRPLEGIWLAWDQVSMSVQSSATHSPFSGLVLQAPRR